MMGRREGWTEVYRLVRCRQESVLSRPRKQQRSQFLIHIAPRSDEDDIEARLLIVNAINDSIRPHAIGPQAGEFKLKGMPDQGRNKKFLDALPDLTFYLRVQLPDSFSRDGSIP